MHTRIKDFHFDLGIVAALNLEVQNSGAGSIKETRPHNEMAVFIAFAVGSYTVPRTVPHIAYTVGMIASYSTRTIPPFLTSRVEEVKNSAFHRSSS